MSLGRPVEYDREVSLRRALDLFWRQGYKGTSLADLCECTRLSKSTLYTVFGDKYRLFLESIRAYSQGLLDDLRSQFASSATPRAFIEAVFADLAEEGSEGRDRRGCLVMNSATEFAQTDSGVAAIVGGTLREMANVFALALDQARAAGQVGQHVDPRRDSLFLVSCIAGMKTMVKGGCSVSELRALGEAAISRL
jgi:AcrR family transcriptional regulator